MSTTNPDTDSDPESYDWQDIDARPHPKRMALDCIWTEVGELDHIRIASDDPDVADAIGARIRTMQAVLEKRLAADYPECPNCEMETLGFTEDGAVICWDCHEAIPDETAQSYKAEHKRVWGARGHGGNNR